MSCVRYVSSLEIAKTLIRLAGEKAVSCGVTNVSCIEELSFIKDLHFRTVDQLGVDRSVVETRMNAYGHMLFLQPKAAATFLYALVYMMNFTL
ncbi:aspartokinase 1 chloroplastic-like, partial [Trifolium medium]|nr:aspartokinase 1 chloroplastic-like [Trifolium medium]